MNKYYYRSFEKNDLDELFELTKLVWGKEVPKKRDWLRGWKWMHIDNPAGKSNILVAEHEDKLIGHYALLKEDVVINRNICKSAQIVDTMTHPLFRRQKIAYNLGKNIFKGLNNEKIQFVYGFPNHNAYPLHIKSGFVNINDLHLMFFPLNIKKIIRKKLIKSEIPLKFLNIGSNLIIKTFFKSNKFKSNNLTIKKIESFDTNIDYFWNEIIENNKIIRLRNNEYMNWRYFDNPNNIYETYAAIEDDYIFGLVTIGIKEEDGITNGYIYDLIVKDIRDDVIKSLISKSIDVFKSKGVDLVLYKKIKNNNYKKSLSSCGFITHINYKGKFVVHNTSLKLPNTFYTNTTNWFIQQGDLPTIY